MRVFVRVFVRANVLASISHTVCADCFHSNIMTSLGTMWKEKAKTGNPPFASNVQINFSVMQVKIKIAKC